VTRIAGVLAAICDTTAILLLFFLVISRVFYASFHLTRQFEFDRVALIVVAIALLLLARAARTLDARVVAAGAGLFVASAVAIVALTMRSVDVADAVKTAGIRVVFRSHEPNIARPDDRYGYVLRPNVQDRHRETDYDVIYTIDGHGRRVTPDPAHPRASIAFVGDSFTFGTGVEDAQAYPALLGADYWKDVKVINAGVEGWGVTQAVITVEDLLSSAAPPSAIVYQIIPDDIYRFYPRETAAGVTPELVRREIQLTRDLVISMRDLCELRHDPFAVVLMLDRGSFPAELMYALGEARIPLVDLTRVRYERFAHDYHPNMADHRRLADAIAASPISAMIR
jgi:hypothetical protein